MLRPLNKKNPTARITICTRACLPTCFGSLITAEKIQSSSTQTCIWHLPSLAPEIPRTILSWDSGSPRLSGMETRTNPESVLQVRGGVPKGGGVCNLPGMSFTWMMLLENYTVPSSWSRWRAWRWDPAHRSAFICNGSQPAKINKSVTVHSSPHHSSIQEEGGKNPPNSC